MPLRRSGFARRAAAGAAVLAAVLAASGCGLLQEADRAGDSSTEESSASASPAAVSVPLYWQGAQGRNIYLFREYVPLQQTDAASAGDVVAGAVAMLGQSSPRDPDYSTPWNPASRVGSAIASDGTLVVDISSDMLPEQATAEQARLDLQELIYTATAAAADQKLVTTGSATKVSVLVDGAKGHQFGGLDLSTPRTRDDGLRAPVWVIDPAQDARDPRTVSVKMAAAHVAARAHWEIRRGDAVVDQGQVRLSDEDTQLQEIQFTRRLAPGQYSIRLWIRNGEVLDPTLVGSDPNGTDLSDGHSFTVADG